VSDRDEVPVEVLLELGRLAWAAIELERLVYDVCRFLHPMEVYDDTPIGPRVDATRRNLSVLADVDLRTQTDDWLRRASDALQERNQVLHGRLFEFEPWLPEINPGNLDPVLAHVTRRDPRTYTHVPFTQSGLAPIRKRIQAARTGGMEVSSRLWATGNLRQEPPVGG
jgi:hypothetical protein